MRGSGDTKMVINEGGNPCGIVLTGNYCSEHEWGIKGLKQTAGILDSEIADKKKIYDFRRIAVNLKGNEDRLVFHDSKDLTILAISNRYSYRREDFEKPSYLREHKIKEGTAPEVAWAMTSYEWGVPDKLKKGEDATKSWKRQTRSAWDEGSFGISTREPEVQQLLRDLHKALLGGDAVIHLGKLGKGNPFEPAGLIIAIASRVDPEAKDHYKAGHEDLAKLEKAAEKTGIEKKLQKAGKKWFALSPKWATEIKSTANGEIKTSHPVIFWLNPMDQHLNNSCWCTVEDLEAWIKGEGPIPKRKG